MEIEFELTIVEAHKGAIQQLVCAFTLITSVMKMREHKFKLSKLNDHDNNKQRLTTNFTPTRKEHVLR